MNCEQMKGAKIKRKKNLLHFRFMRRKNKINFGFLALLSRSSLLRFGHLWLSTKPHFEACSNAAQFFLCNSNYFCNFRRHIEKAQNNQCPEEKQANTDKIPGKSIIFGKLSPEKRRSFHGQHLWKQLLFSIPNETNAVELSAFLIQILQNWNRGQSNTEVVLTN